ncbi:hypothetical protein [Allobranchiibius sp. CTAmp26]|uniref:hypothetical protein n=1 Tax=Allobranchiibius sp. CTAmp26 TaxID=2815214 RepID=UPI001AA131B4|nr:hypothetical protein [Allobranchiibius sp. CTAmp26]MBO1755085.1 hypothetical protein [Allobranchiibius sp. CTAmp26]
MIRRSAITVVPVVAALGVALAAPAVAAGGHHPVPGAAVRAMVRTHAKSAGPYGSCSLVVPAAVRVVRPGTAVPVRVTGGCAVSAHPSTIAGWYIGPERAPVDYISFDFSNRSSWEVFSFTPLGTRTWLGDVAFDADSENERDYAQNAPRTTVKVGSWAGLSSSRKGNTVTLSTRVVRYSTSRDENIVWAGENGVIQYRAVGGTAWTALKNITSSAKGTASYTYTSSAARDYRVVYGETTYVWGATSPTSRR